MALSYWGRNLDDLDGTEDSRIFGRWVSERRKGGCLEDLKGLVSRGIPVPIAPSGLTPFAHPTNPLLSILRGLPPDPSRVTSGFLLGVFVPRRTGSSPHAGGRMHFPGTSLMPPACVDPDHGGVPRLGMLECNGRWKVGDETRD